MLERKELYFQRRSILTAAQLRAIEEFPREILRLKYADFGNGIISGVDFVERNREIWMTEGIIKIGNLFYRAEEINLSALATGTRDGVKYHFVLTKPQRIAEENVVTEKISVEVRKFEENFNGIEFGRFTGGLRRLPQIDADDLLRAYTANSSFNLLNVPYSARNKNEYSGTTFHPYIFRAILAKLERKEKPTPGDTALMIHLANFGVANIPTLKVYVKGNGVDWRDDSREDIFRSVLDAVEAEWKIELPEKHSTPIKSPKPTSPRSGRIFVN